jgi:hypothetical protein
MDNILDVVKVLKEDLIKSIRGNQDVISVQGEFIIIEVPNDIDFELTFRDLYHIVTSSFYEQNLSRVKFQVTNGIKKQDVFWGF